MTQKAITLFVVPTVIAVVVLVMISIGVLYLTIKYLVLFDQAEAYHSVSGGRAEVLCCQMLTGGFGA
jgi:hypothetical protein